MAKIKICGFKKIVAIVLVALVEKSISRVDLGDDDDLYKDQGIAERGKASNQLFGI